jgi:hypothetical protein
MAVAPERLAERIEHVFTASELEERVATSMELIAEALALTPPTPNVLRARTTIEASLRTRGR